jgi:hypothetical protein
VIAYKFLAAGRRGRFSNFTWPEPGEWVRASGPLDACRSGIHACAVDQLPFWLDEELWAVELGGETIRRGNQLVAESGQLTEQITAWSPATAHEYAEACARRGASHAIAALREAGHAGAAERIEGATAIEDLRSTAAEIAELYPDTRIAVMMARDGARRALTHAAPPAAYIAAHTAARVGGPEGYASERRWQADWLAERLGLGTA